MKEAELSAMRRLGDSAGNILAVQGNLANTYGALGRDQEALRLRQEVYSGYVKLLGEAHRETILEANNYASFLLDLERFKEAKSLLRKTMPAARRFLGESHRTTLSMRTNYAEALYKVDGATLDDLSKAVSTLEDAARTARRVLGGAHPLTTDIEDELQECRAAGLARMPAEPRFDKSTRASTPAKGLVHYLGRLKKAKWRGSARKIAKFGRKVQKYSKLAVAAVEDS